jgi:hypothetical protein
MLQLVTKWIVVVAVFNATEFTGAIVNPTIGVWAAEPSTGNASQTLPLLGPARNGTTAFPTVDCSRRRAHCGRRRIGCRLPRAELQYKLALRNPSSNQYNRTPGRTRSYFPAKRFVDCQPCTTDGALSVRIMLAGLGPTLRKSACCRWAQERCLVRSWRISRFEAFDPFVATVCKDRLPNQEGQPTFLQQQFSINNPFLTDVASKRPIGRGYAGATTLPQ